MLSRVDSLDASSIGLIMEEVDHKEIWPMIAFKAIKSAVDQRVVKETTWSYITMFAFHRYVNHTKLDGSCISSTYFV